VQVAAVYAPVMPFWSVKLSTSSPLVHAVVIWTVALAKFVLSASLTVMVELIAVAAWFSVYESAPASMFANTGASLTGVTVMLRVWVLLDAVPSLTWKVTVRIDVFGLSLVLLYFTARSAVS
jgi:hypothetical protein